MPRNPDACAMKDVRCVDDTKTTNAEKWLKLLLHALDSTPTGVTISSPAGKILYINPAEAEMHGYAPEELVGSDISVFAPEYFRRRMDPEELKNISRNSRESLNVRKDGSTFPVRIRYAPVFNEAGRLLGKVSTCEDISEEFKVRQQIENAQAKLAEIMEASADALLVTDSDLTIVLANSAFSEMVGLPAKDILGSRCHEITKADMCNECLAQPGRLFVATNREVKIERSDGTPLLCLLNTRKLIDPENNKPCLIHSFRDITELRRLESIAATADLMENIGLIFSGIRHEIGNPLNTIINTARIIDSDLESISRDRLKKYISWILEESGRIEYLLKSMKNYSIFDKVHNNMLDLVAFIKKFLPIIMVECRVKGIEVAWEPPSCPVYVLAEGRALHHVLINIVVNAIHALEESDHPRIVITLNRRKKQRVVELRVSDNGPGIPEKMIPQLFKPLFSTKAGGSGLGLTIVKKILARMEASIEVRSNVGEGTTMVILMKEEGRARLVP